MRGWPRSEACLAVAGGELCQAAAWSGLICVACGMRETESGLRSWCTDEARCAARMRLWSWDLAWCADTVMELLWVPYR